MECSINIKLIWSKVSFKACVSLLIFCLDDTPIDESGVLKSPARICNFRAGALTCKSQSVTMILEAEVEGKEALGTRSSRIRVTFRTLSG